jgi:hypothetical protein
MLIASHLVSKLPAFIEAESSLPLSQQLPTNPHPVENL